MSYHKEIEQLRKHMLSASEFSTVWNDFYDLVERPGFIAQSKVLSDPRLATVLLVMCRSIVGNGGAALDSCHLLQYQGSQFVHGLLTYGGHVANVMYFPDIDTGMMVLSLPFDSNLRFMRFACAQCTASGDVVPGVSNEGDSLLH